MPDWKPEIKCRLEGLQLSPAREAAVVDELSEYLDDCYTELLANNVPPSEAECRTLTELDGSEALKRELRRARYRAAPEPIISGSNQKINIMRDLWQDIRYGARMLIKKPGFAAIAIVTLALGIGVNSAVFSVVNAALVAPLPYPEAEQLVRVWETNSGRGWTEFPASTPNFEDWRTQQSVFEQLAAWEHSTFNLIGDGEPERVGALSVTPNLFSVLKVAPASGRSFLPEEDQAGRNRVAIISHGLWQRRFGGDPTVVGKTIQLSGEAYGIVGVMPAKFQLTRRTDLWVPLILDAKVLRYRANRSHHTLSVIGRLRGGATLAAAQAEMDTIAGRLAGQHPDSNNGWGVQLVTFYDWVVPPPARRSVLVLFAAVGFVMLIGCANVANLLLARAVGRRREMAIRVALGASRMRVLRQLLAESLLLALIGGVAGSLLAVLGIELLKKSMSLGIPRIDEANLDLSVFVFTTFVSLLTGLLFGLAPAWHATQADPASALGQARTSLGGARQRLNRALIIGEFAIAVVLLIGAGLMIRSFQRLQNVPLGFLPEKVLTMQIGLPVSKYGTNAQRINFFDQLLEKFRATPGVVDAAAITETPFSGGNWAMEITLEGAEKSPDGAKLSADTRAVTPHYLRTMGIPLLEGRDFSEQDRGDFGAVPLTVIVSETFAHRHWPNENPIGKRFRPGNATALAEVVGMAGNVRSLDLRTEARPAFYFSYGHIGMPTMTLVTRTREEPEAMAAILRGQVYSVDRDLPIYNIRTMEQIISNSEAQSRSQTILLGLFSLLALLLAAVGIYGLMSFSVAQRTSEIGIHLALGARAGDVMRLVIGQGMKLAVAGIAIGIAGGFALTGVMKTLLFNVSPTDPFTFTSIAMILALVALAAIWVPARRATRVDPMIALRWE